MTIPNVLDRSPLVLPCEKSADANDSGDIDLSDAVHRLLVLFKGLEPAQGSGPGCCADETPDGLSCEVYVPCRE